MCKSANRVASEAIIAAHTAQCVNLLTAWLAKLLLLRTQLSVLAQYQFFIYYYCFTGDAERVANKVSYI